MSTKSIAEVMLDTLEAAGVKRVYGLPGDSLNAITDLIGKRRTIEWVHVRHEETAAFAASAEAALTGSLAVCAASCGPGNLHLINGLFDAYRSRVPVLAIAAQIPSAELGSGYFQETHPELIFQTCSDYCELVSQPEQMPRLLDIAMQTAINRSTVAVLIIPGDLATKPSASPGPRLRFSPPKPTVVPSPVELDDLAARLNQAKQVTILGGAGCAGSHAELVAVAAQLQAPIVHALRGKEFIEYDNPFDVGMTGLLGFPSGYHAMMNADTLLILGSDFPYQNFYPPDASIIQIDIRGEQLGKRTKLDLGLIGDVRETLAALLPRLKKKDDGKHLEKARSHYQGVRKELDELAHGTPGGAPLHPQFVARTISDLASDDAVFTADVGSPILWAARYLRMNGRRRFISSCSHGSMANAMTQAIGAQSAFPQRQVVAMSGDGGIAMLMGDLLTLIQMKLPVKVVVFRNDSLAFVELEMKSAGYVNFGTDLKNPDFAQVAVAAGILGIRVETSEELRPAMQRAFEHTGPALIEVLVNRQELSIPPTITLDQARGFSLYMLRAVLSGRGDEILDLATTNTVREIFGVVVNALHS